MNMTDLSTSQNFYENNKCTQTNEFREAKS